MGNRYEFIAPCHFGLEAVCKREIADLGYEIVKVEDGKVMFAGDMEALVRANIFLRTTQRILLKVAEFKAVTFEELFQNVSNTSPLFSTTAFISSLITSKYGLFIVIQDAPIVLFAFPVSFLFLL